MVLIASNRGAGLVPSPQEADSLYEEWKPQVLRSRREEGIKATRIADGVRQLLPVEDIAWHEGLGLEAVGTLEEDRLETKDDVRIRVCIEGAVGVQEPAQVLVYEREEHHRRSTDPSLEVPFHEQYSLIGPIPRHTEVQDSSVSESTELLLPSLGVVHLQALSEAVSVGGHERRFGRSVAHARRESVARRDGSIWKRVG